MTAAPSQYRHNSYAERVVYLAVALTWWYCITKAMEPFGQGGTASLRGPQKFLWLALSASPPLALCAFTSPYTTAGHVFRWLALSSIVITAGMVWPLVALFVMWFLAAAVGVADGEGMVPFFVGAIALLVATLLLVKELMLTRRNASPAELSTPPA